MKNSVIKDYNKRLSMAILETECITLKALSHNRILPALLRTEVPTAPVHISKIRNICRLTGRSRGIVRKLGISNIKFRELADIGALSGWRRSSW